MTTLSTIIIQHDNNAIVALLDVDGTDGKLTAKTRGNGRTGMVNIVMKLKGEKPVTITALQDNFNVYDLPLLLEEYIDTDYVAKWNYPLEDHAA